MSTHVAPSSCSDLQVNRAVHPKPLSLRASAGCQVAPEQVPLGSPWWWQVRTDRQIPPCSQQPVNGFRFVDGERHRPPSHLSLWCLGCRFHILRIEGRATPLGTREAHSSAAAWAAKLEGYVLVCFSSSPACELFILGPTYWLVCRELNHRKKCLWPGLACHRLHCSGQNCKEPGESWPPVSVWLWFPSQ